MKAAVRGGHSEDIRGANGVVDEVTEDRKIAAMVVEYLRLDNNNVLDVTPGNSGTSGRDLSIPVSNANNWGADYFASIHLNAGCGHGVEVLYKSQKGKEYADRIVAKLAALGFANRGSKLDVRGLYEFNHVIAPNNIIECFFCDSQSDVDLYNKLGVDVIAKAIAEGIVGHSIGATQQSQANPQPVKQAPQLNQSVLKLQNVLNKLLKLGISEDGIMGNQTKNATIKLQQILGLSADGIAGNQTWNAINSILAEPFLKVGINGIATRYVQYRVGTSYDGIFGNGTKSAVIRYQSGKGLCADGIVGQNTWNALLG